MDKKIIHITYFICLLLIVSCAKNETKISKSTPVYAEEEAAEYSKDDKEANLEISDEFENEINDELDEKLEVNTTEYVKTGKQSIVLNKLNEELEFYKLLNDSKIEESFKAGIKNDLKLVFDDSNWEDIKSDIKNFKLITTPDGNTKAFFEVDNKTYSTLVDIKTTSQNIEGINRKSFKINFSNLSLQE